MDTIRYIYDQNKKNNKFIELHDPTKGMEIELATKEIKKEKF